MTTHHAILSSLVAVAFLAFWVVLLADGMATARTARRQRDDR
jgi:hypothetical protein